MCSLTRCNGEVSPVWRSRDSCSAHRKKAAQSLAVCSQQGVFLVLHLIFPSQSCHNPREWCSPPGPTSCSSLRRKDEWFWGHGSFMFLPGTPQLSGCWPPVSCKSAGWLELGCKFCCLPAVLQHPPQPRISDRSLWVPLEPSSTAQLWIPPAAL